MKWMFSILHRVFKGPETKEWKDYGTFYAKPLPEERIFYPEDV